MSKKGKEISKRNSWNGRRSKFGKGKGIGKGKGKGNW